MHAFRPARSATIVWPQRRYPLFWLRGVVARHVTPHLHRHVDYLFTRILTTGKQTRSTANQRVPDGSTPTSSNSSSSFSPPASRAVRRRRTHRVTSSSHFDTGTLHRSTPSVVSDPTSPSLSFSGSPSPRDSLSVSGSPTTLLRNSPVPPAHGSRAASTIHRSSRPSRVITPPGHFMNVPDEAAMRIPIHAELPRPWSPSGHDPEPLDHGPVSPTHHAVLSARGLSSSSMEAPASLDTLLHPRSSSSLSKVRTLLLTLLIRPKIRVGMTLMMTL
ncbi:hypothetical protein HPB51_001911 [Rhipicephalus microplus]|uniref:Uncharacterized protein n=1 Tax=Rhipicephalus microplus TaxID=6941 RepID=A0A9J6DYI0_RHIMP|nr:hypothetical protein HPB51_001911 [Rhipicephalus microplus]